MAAQREQLVGVRQRRLHSVELVVDGVQALGAGMPVQIEVESLAELEEALACGATSVLLDDFSLDDMQRAYALNKGRALLEASGSVDLNRVRDIARTGVDRISIGKLTKNEKAVGLSMRVLA